MERKTRLELATLTLARLCSTNWAISAFLHPRVVFSFADAKVDLFFESPKLFGFFFRNVCGSSFPMGVEGWSGRGLCGWFSVGYFHEESRQGGAGSLFDFYTPMQDVTPKVVAMAVSTVITMFRILLQMFLFSISDLWFMISFFCTTEYTEFHWVFSLLFSTFCHSDDHREEESRVHPHLFSIALCPRDPSLRSGWHCMGRT